MKVFPALPRCPVCEAPWQTCKHPSAPPTNPKGGVTINEAKKVS